MRNPALNQQGLPAGRTAPLSRGERISATAEVLLGATVVIGHNVYRVLPNEVPILVAILWVSVLCWRSWSSPGLSRPSSWKVVALVAVCGAILLQVKDLITEPLAHLIWHQQEKVSSVIASLHQHSPLLALKSLAIV